MTSNECNISSECTIDSNIVRECYEKNNFRDEVFFCDCSNYYGWVGEECDEISSTVHWERFTFIVFTIWGIFNILTLLKSLFRYIKFKFHRNMSRKDINPVFYVNVYALLSVLFFVLWNFVRLRTFYDPRFFKIIDFNGEESVQRGNHELEYSFLYLTFVFQVLASMQIVISWLDVFVNLSKVFPKEGEKETVSERNLQRIMWIIAFLVIGPSLIILILERRFEILVAYAFLSIVVAIGYVIGYFRLLKKFRIYSVDASKKTNSLKLIRIAFKVNMVCSIMIVIFTVLFIGSNLIFQQTLKIGGFNYFQVLADISTCFGLFLVSYTSFYVFKVNCRLIKSQHRISWFPFMDCCVKHKPLPTSFPATSDLLRSGKSNRQVDVENNI